MSEGGKRERERERGSCISCVTFLLFLGGTGVGLNLVWVQERRRLDVGREIGEALNFTNNDNWNLLSHCHNKGIAEPSVGTVYINLAV